MKTIIHISSAHTRSDQRIFFKQILSLRKNGYKVIFTEVNCSEETAEVDKMMNQYNVEGYPTIKLLKDGQIIEYDAKPSKDTLTKFLNTVL